MQNCLVSIIIVSYNHVRYVVECLESISNQTYNDWELIVADDASSDNTVAIINEWLADKGLEAKKIYNQVNLGLCKTLNKCIEAATGQYIKAIAADDYLHPNYLFDVLNKFESKDKDLGIVFTNCFCCDEQSNITNDNFLGTVPNLGDGWIHEKLLKANMLPALTAIVKAEVYQKVGNYDDSIWIEDWEFWLRASKSYKFAYVNKSLAYYRLHSSNVSKNLENMIEGELKIVLKYGNALWAKEIVNNHFRDKFYQTVDKKKVLKLYQTYPLKNKLLLFFFKTRLPRVLLRFYQKLFLRT